MNRVLPYAWYPLFMVAALLSFLSMVTAGMTPLLAAYIPATIAGVSILLLELRFPERADWKPRFDDVKADAAFMVVVMILVPRLLMAGATLLLAGFAHESFASAWWPHEWPLLGQMLAMVLVVDFVRYWLHRAAHRFMPLWRLHEVHHSPDILYVMNVGRFHPVEKVLHFALDTVPFLVLGLAPEVLAGYFLLYSVNGFFQHSNLRLRYGWLNYVVGSAETHRWHHARDPKLAACNFGNTTLVWDLVFSTWHLPGPVGEVGIPNREYPKGFVAQMVAPFRRKDGRRRRDVTRWLADTLVGLQLRVRSLSARARVAGHMRDPMRAQDALLARILEQNRDSTFGRERSFRCIGSYEEFARAVPVAEFESLRLFIEAEIKSGDNALTAEIPQRYVRTSGTTGVPKDIPLTPSHLEGLRRIHQDAVAFQHHACPEAFNGGIIAMVSPAFEGELGNGKPFGSASGIVAGNTPHAVLEKFVIPAEVLTISDSRVKYLLALRLAIARADVTYMGAANPTTLLTLARLFREHQVELIQDLRAGTFFLQDRVPPEVMDVVRRRLLREPDRADELAAIADTKPEVRLGDIWPAARLAVTWTCASAGVAVDALRHELSSRTRIMELGYVSSEFRGTITLGKRAEAGLPTIDTHFFEFVDRDRWDAGDRVCLTLGQVKKGREYYVIVTTPSGLYRYFINDIVKVTGFLGAIPLLKFMQKGKGVTSITGEKLYEAQVLQAVRESMAMQASSARFVMMLADEEGQRYRLYVEPEPGASFDAAALARSTDERLSHLNVEYQAKRESERLAPLVACALKPDTGEAYKAHCVKNGQREGQFKMVALEYRRKFSFALDAYAMAG